MKLVVYCSRKFNDAVEKWRVPFTEYSYKDLFGNKVQPEVLRGI